MFIGVCGASAPLDNYVGCNVGGYGFLANRAIWNNKVKLKAYGELYKTGDIVTVTLDCDSGTLSFDLNGQLLGVAVEGLNPPLYAAFSMYNKLDQITLLSRASTKNRGHSSVAAGLGTGKSSRRLLERSQLVDSYSRAFVTTNEETGLFRQHLLRRFNSWSHGSFFRSFIHKVSEL
jgi:hypothetical protein